MKLADVPSGTRVFLDANILVYAFTSEPTFGSPCIDFLERGNLKKVLGTESDILIETVPDTLKCFGLSCIRTLPRVPHRLATVATLNSR